MTSRSLFRRLLVLSIAAAVLPVVAAPPAAPAPAANSPAIPRTLDVPNNALVAPGPPPELDLLYTGDVIGYLEDCGCHMNPAGGLSRRAWLLGQLENNYPATPLVLLDSGNFSDNPTEKGDLRTATLLKSMKRLGYRAVNIGERDLTLGYEDFVTRTKGTGLSFLSTNIVKQGTKDTVFDPYVVFTVEGTSRKPVRIGVMGVDRYSPVWQKAGPPGSNLALAAPADMIAKVLPKVRAESDVVILLAALSKEDAHDLAIQFPEIDLVLGAYAGVFSTVEEREGNTRIYYTGNQGKRIGESRVTLDAARHITDVTTYMHFLTVRYPVDKTMDESIADVIAKTKAVEEPDVAPVKAPAAGGH